MKDRRRDVGNVRVRTGLDSGPEVLVRTDIFRRSRGTLPHRSDLKPQFVYTCVWVQDGGGPTHRKDSMSVRGLGWG